MKSIENWSKMHISEVGDIRKITAVNETSNRLGLVLAIDETSGSAIVGLLTNLVEIATPRDLILSKELTKLNYDLALLTDFVGRVTLAQLDENIALGKISLATVREFLEERKSKIFGSLNVINIDNGKYPIQENDAVWYWRKSEYDNWIKLTYRKTSTSLRHAAATLSAFEENSNIDAIEELTADSLRLLMLTKGK